jgi:arginase family enzyme
MLDTSMCVLNLDNSLVRQATLLGRYKSAIVDLLDLGPRCRLWMNRVTRGLIRQRLKGIGGTPVFFLGSGDFHHLSEILISRISEPISLIVFDFHPDWDTLPPRFGCGSWLTEALKRKNILRCGLFGVSSTDISAGNIQHGNLKALDHDRLLIYPYAHPATNVFIKRVPANSSLRLEQIPFGRSIHWAELKASDLAARFKYFLNCLPGKKVYISLDKDCLTRDYALTNWEEGLMPLDEILLMLKLIKDNLDIVGMDITGEYSPVNISGRFKNIISRMDHPKNIPSAVCDEDQINAVNQKTNLRILETIFS